MDGEELYDLMQNSSDHFGFQEMLNKEQLSILRQYMERAQFDKAEDITKQLQEYIEENPEMNRNVTPFFRVKVLRKTIMCY